MGTGATVGLYRIGVGFRPLGEMLYGARITASGLHGVLFHVLRQSEPEEATWLHTHPAPKPYTLAAYYSADGALVGIRLTALGERAATALMRGWLLARERGEVLSLGSQRFRVAEVESVYDDDVLALQGQTPASRIGLRFVAPTSFRQGPGDLPLPLPGQVFRRPESIWNAQVPPMQKIPAGWLSWCEQNVFVVQHNIQTVTVAIKPREAFTGFVGEVWFEAHGRYDFERRVWATLGRLLPFCGCGRKTTMGMGAVELIEIES